MENILKMLDEGIANLTFWKEDAEKKNALQAATIKALEKKVADLETRLSFYENKVEKEPF